MSKKKTRDAVDIVRRRYVGDDPDRLAELQQARLHADIARQIYERRDQAGLSQRQLAALVGTTQSVISRLESADYAGHSLSMLTRIASALDQELSVVLRPVRASRERTSCRVKGSERDKVRRDAVTGSA